MIQFLLSLVAGFAGYQPATVQPPVTRPPTAACTAHILEAYRFVNGGHPALRSYTPGCAGPWTKVVLTMRTRIAGPQYDRIGGIWIGRSEVLRFTTAEPTNAGIVYTVEKDVTEYAPLLRHAQPVAVELGNYTNKKYTGIYVVDVDLTFYRADAAHPAPAGADEILPLDNETDSTPWFALTSEQQRASATFARLPRNIERATLELYETSHGCDEFWYTNQDDAYAAKHKRDQLCGGGAYREIDVRVDGRLAAIVYPFPYIYTGGINPYLWRPLSAIQTLNVAPHDVDLDPWAGVLSDGKAHTIAVSVVNDRGSWPIDASLFLWRDPHSARTSGAITASYARPLAVLQRDDLTAHGGRFSTRVVRAWFVRGYVNTSHGRVTHALASLEHFVNEQDIDLATGRGDATQRTDFATTTTISDARGARAETLTGSYPIVADSIYPPLKKGPYDLVIGAEVHQGLHVASPSGRCDETVDASAYLLEAHQVDTSIRSGKTSEHNACSGTFGSFNITKRAVDGTLRASGSVSPKNHR